MHTDLGMTGISLLGFMPYMTVASLEMSDDPKMNIADFPNSSQLTYRLAIGNHSLLLLFQKPLKSRYFRPRIPLRANMRLSWAIKWRFWDTISLFLRWIFLWTYVLRVHARTSIEFVVRNVASIWLKTAKMSGKLPKNLFFPFPDCIFKRNIFKYQYAS